MSGKYLIIFKIFRDGVPDGIRTRVTAVKGRFCRPPPYMGDEDMPMTLEQVSLAIHQRSGVYMPYACRTFGDADVESLAGFEA